jgi:hypothetical protein
VLTGSRLGGVPSQVGRAFVVGLRLTGRSSADPLRQAAWPAEPALRIIGSAGQASCLRGRLSSNVSPHVSPNGHASALRHYRKGKASVSPRATSIRSNSPACCGRFLAHAKRFMGKAKASGNVPTTLEQRNTNSRLARLPAPCRLGLRCAAKSGIPPAAAWAQMQGEPGWAVGAAAGGGLPSGLKHLLAQQYLATPSNAG